MVLIASHLLFMVGSSSNAKVAPRLLNGSPFQEGFGFLFDFIFCYSMCVAILLAWMEDPSSSTWWPEPVEWHRSPGSIKAVLDVLYMVRTFHAPMPILVLGPSRLAHLAKAKLTTAGILFWLFLNVFLYTIVILVIKQKWMVNWSHDNVTDKRCCMWIS